MTPFFVPCGNVYRAERMPFWCPLFCIRQSRFYYIADQQVVDFIIFSFVPVAYDDFTIWVSGEPSRASDELNDFLILTNERPTRFYYLFRGWTSRTIFLYWPTKAILIFRREIEENPSDLEGRLFRLIQFRKNLVADIFGGARHVRTDYESHSCDFV